MNNLKNLVEGHKYRLLQIIEYLLLQDYTISSQEAAVLNNTSVITAKKDLEMIYDRFGDFFDAEMVNNTLVFKKRNTGNFRKVSSVLLDESTNIQLISYIFENPYEDILDICLAINISEASFYRNLKEINQVLNRSNIRIRHKNGRYFLDNDDEFQFRNFMSLFYLETKGTHHTFETVRFWLVHDTIKNIILNAFDFKSDLSYLYLSYFYYISIFRESQGFELEMNSNIVLASHPEEAVFKSYFPNLKTKNFTTIRESIQVQAFPWETPSQRNQVLNTFKELTNDIVSFFTCPMDKQELIHLFVVFYSHVKNFPNNDVMYINRVDIFAYQFQQNHPYAVTVFQNILDKYEHHLDIPLSDVRSYLIYLLNIQCPSLYINLGQPKVMVMSDLGRNHRDFLIKILQQAFPDIKIVHDGDFDFIITTYGGHIEFDKIIEINDYPDQDDLARIRKFSNKILIKKRTDYVD